MDAAQLELIVRNVISGEVLRNWNLYALMLAIVLVGGAAVSYLAAYLQARAKTYATKADFEELLDQLKQNTEATEKIKAEVSHEDWKIRDLRLLRRVKLEELIFAVHSSAHWLHMRQQWWFTDKDDSGQDPSFKVTALGALYFPELKSIDRFETARAAHSLIIVECKKKLFDANLQAKQKSDSSLYSTAFNEVQSEYKKSYPDLVNAVGALSAECAALMKKELS